MTDCAQAFAGAFGLAPTPRLRSLLADVARSDHVGAGLQDACRAALDQEQLPWRLVKAAAEQARRASLATPAAAELCAGSRLLLPSPPPRQRSEQLTKRLAQLQDSVDAARYAAMVADVTRQERAAADAVKDPFFPSTKLQLSFGLHVIVTMGTFAALGFYAGRLAFGSESWAAACAALGLTAGLLLETSLLIIRMNLPQPLEETYKHLVGKEWEQQQQPKEAARVAGSSSSSKRGAAAGNAQGNGAGGKVAEAGLRQRRKA